MASDTTYSVGTVSVLTGGTTVTGVGTSWAGKVYAGDLLHDPAQGIIARVTADATSNTSLSINAWPGTALAGAAYEILFQPDSVRTSERARRLLELVTQINNTGIGIDAFGLFAGRTTYDAEATGFAYLSMDGDGALITDGVVFIKASSTSGDWSTAIEYRGPQGPSGLVGVWRGAWVTATAYALNDIVSNAGSSYICTVAHTSGATFAGDAANWEVAAQKGDTGAPGAIGGSTGSTDNRLLRSDGAGGATLQASAVTVDDSGHITGFGGNIKFPSTQAASADPNTLDDYEEGTFTPVVTFGGLSTGITYNFNTGTYTKVGRLVQAAITLSLTNKGSATGTAKIDGLPFASVGRAGFSVATALNFTGMTGGLYGLNDNATDEVALYQSSATGNVAITNAVFTNDTFLYGSLVYTAV